MNKIQKCQHMPSDTRQQHLLTTQIHLCKQVYKVRATLHSGKIISYLIPPALLKYDILTEKTSQKKQLHITTRLQDQTKAPDSSLPQRQHCLAKYKGGKINLERVPQQVWLFSN